MNGETVKGCEHCYGQVNREVGSRYYEAFSRDYANQVDAIIESTESDGSTTFVPQDFDYRTSLCNLSCKTCCADSSSSISAHSNRSAGKKVFPIVNYKDSFSRQWDDAKKLLTPETRAMYWAGGEPTMNPIYWKTLSYLEENGWFDIKMNYHINLMTLNKEEIYQKALKNFELFNSHVNVSLDGMGQVGEYVRNGLNWELFDQLYSRLINDGKRTTFIIDVTMTNLTFLQLPDLLRYAISKNGRIEFKAMFESPGISQDGIYHNYNKFLSLNLINQDTFDRIALEVEEILNCNQLITNLPNFMEFVKETHEPRFMTHEDNVACEQMEERHGNTISLIQIIRDQSLVSLSANALANS